MVQTLKTYLRRLTNLTARNRSLVLTTLPAEQFLDVHDLDFLDGRPSFDVLAQLLAQRPVVPLCDVLDPRYERLNAVSGRLRRIARTEAFIRQERGAEDLYVGYPFVRGKFADGTVVRGPLVFFPVTLEVVRQKWVLRRRGEPPFLNPSFLLAYSHFNSVKLPDELLEKTFAEPTDRDALTFRTQLYEFLKQSPVVLNFNPDLFSPHLLPFERVTKSELEQSEKTGELKLYPQAVLGIFPQAGSYLVPDYEQLIGQMDNGQWIMDNEKEGIGALFHYPLSIVHYPFKEADSLLPFAVDASQEAAIQRVKAGESLVIQGPPGTGKSQVIANLMADFAARGKRVLLVCQKRAALDTVYARLRQIGMADFAALIHDFQHDRAPLYAQLAGQIERLDDYRRQNQSLDTIFLEREFSQTARRIEQLTGQLQEFHDALFDERVCGASAKELYLTSNPDGGRVDLGSWYKSFQFGQLDEFLRRLDRWETYETRLAGSPWHPERVDFSRFTNRDVPELEAVLDDVPAFARHLSEQTTALLGQPLAWAEAVALDDARDRWQQALRLADDEAVWPLLQHALTGRYTADFPHWLDAQRAALDALWRQGLVGASLPTAALPRFHQTVRAALDARRSVWGWWFFKEKEPLRAEATRYGLTLSLADLQRLNELVEARLAWERTLVEVETRAGVRLLTDAPTTTQAAFEAFHQNVTQAAETRQLLGKKSDRLYQLARQSPDRAAFRRVVEALLASVQPIPERLRRWRIALAEGPLMALLHGTAQPEALKTALRRDFELLREMDTLKSEFSRTEWDVLQHLQNHSITQSLSHSVTNSLRLAWLDDLETRFPVLRSVSGLQMEQWETELQVAIERKQALSREILLLRLRERTYENVERNRLNNVVTYRDLKHQVTKKRSIWPVRKLLSELSGEVFQLTPCWLASPESVSALFPLNAPHPLPPEGGLKSEHRNPLQGAGGEGFDLVIFDEASQCYAEQGIPALARGRQVVVAGDRQQLQPSDVYRVRFEDDTDDNPDLEVDSLLDLAARYLPQTALRGHYRSRSLDLIQFSNRHFYKNSLQLLPDFAEINRHEPAIRYLHVQGHWQDQQNGVEAEAVLGLLRDLAQSEPELSVGVVTFNFRQQNLIQDLLEAQSTNNEAQSTKHEPLFIKNIENVQGDERDVIIFSVGYAPDNRGRVSAQFGSLNAKGGENRLNVAVTRARRRVYVVCSLWPEQLDVQNTLNEGPKLLKAYLRFARDVSEGRFQPQPAEENALSGRPLLKEKLRAGHPGLREELPFADLTEKSGETYQNLVLTDDEAYFASLSPKEPHAYLPLTLRAKGWPFRRVWSREWWKSAQSVE